jgi:hypothetical protein
MSIEVQTGFHASLARTRAALLRLGNIEIEPGTSLPYCEGPNLATFCDGEDELRIEFKRLIGQGVHSYVFEAEIKGKTYAVKGGMSLLLSQNIT